MNVNGSKNILVNLMLANPKSKFEKELNHLKHESGATEGYILIPYDVYRLFVKVKEDLMELVGEDELLGGLMIYDEQELIRRLKKWFEEDKSDV